jgi:hypothetical protein
MSSVVMNEALVVVAHIFLILTLATITRSQIWCANIVTNRVTRPVSAGNYMVDHVTPLLMLLKPLVHLTPHHHHGFLTMVHLIISLVIYRIFQ